MPDWLLALVVNIPLASAVAYGFISRKVRSEGEFLDQQKAFLAEQTRREDQHTREIAYLDARRTEEREGRLAAERRVTALTERWDRALDTLAGIERELIRGAGRSGPDAPPR